jgi:cell wall-associated NlpC family hydrolase
VTDRRVDPDPAIAQTDTPGQIAWAHADLLASPAGARDRQLLLGEAVSILGSRQRHSYVRAAKDGYIGFVDGLSIGFPTAPTHLVTAPATHAYTEPSIKSADLMTLSFGARITATAQTEAFVETAHGHIPKAAITEIPVPRIDRITTARLFLGTPYLWGGNTRAGMDCSGLIQAACLAAHIPCPGDSDQQERALGTPVADDTYEAGDVLFWKGHVALVTSNRMMIHANAHHMQVVEEAIAPALIRIKANGGGPLTAHKRL